MTLSNGNIFPSYWPFVCGIHQPPMDSPHKGHWRAALMFYLICAWTKRWVNNGDTYDLRRHRAHYDLSVMNFDMTVTYNELLPHFSFSLSFFNALCSWSFFFLDLSSHLLSTHFSSVGDVPDKLQRDRTILNTNLRLIVYWTGLWGPSQ